MNYFIKQLAFLLIVLILSVPLNADFIVTEKGDIGDLRWWSEETVMSGNTIFVFGHMENNSGVIVYKLYTIDTVTDDQSDIMLTWEDESPVKTSLNAAGFFYSNTVLVHWREADYYSAGNSAEVTGILNVSTGVVTKWQADPAPLINAPTEEKPGIISDLNSFYANGAYVLSDNILFKQGIDKDTNANLYCFNTTTHLTESVVTAGIYSYITGFNKSENKIHVLWPDSGVLKYGKMGIDGIVEATGDFTALKTFQKAYQNDAAIIISGLDFSNQKKLYEYSTITGKIESSPFIDQSRQYNISGITDDGRMITLWWDSTTQKQKYGMISNNATITLTGDAIVSEGAGLITITANLANISSETVTIRLTYNKHGGDTARFLSDYTGPTEPFIEIPSGSLSGTLNINIENDTLFEPGGEVFTLSVTDVINGIETGVQRVAVIITEEDFDDDSLPDDWEKENNAEEPDGDDDNDGVSNLDEYQNHSDPHDTDTDNDGLSDNEEINNFGTNPSKSDTDNDGYSDKTEILHGTDPTIAEVQPPEYLVIHVSETASGTGTGLSWENAFTELYHALELSPWLLSGDQIWVASGIYHPDTKYFSDPRDASFTLLNGIGIYGGFIGVEFALEDRTPLFNPTVLSGDIGVEGDITDNCYHVVYLPDTAGIIETAILDGFEISNGNANGNGGKSFGGGMYINNCSPSLSQIAFTNNFAAYGGGMFNKNAAPLLSQCIFINNNAAKSGGGIHATGSTLIINNSIFNSNSSMISGGAVTLYKSTSTIRNSLFFDNTCNHSGAAVNADNSDLVITETTLTQNSAKFNSGSVHTVFSTIEISGCIIWGNFPEGVNRTDSTLTIRYSVIPGGYDGEGNTGDDPYFANPEEKDFTLNADSPCVGAGNPEATEDTNGTTDLSGNFRISCFTIDMGAFELPEPICNGQSAAPAPTDKNTSGGGCFIETASYSTE